MKKVLLSLLCAIFLLQGCSKQNEGEPIELTAQEVLVRLQDPKKNSFMLYITSENCYSCDEYEKIIQEIEEETPFEIYYLKIQMKRIRMSNAHLKNCKLRQEIYRACRLPFIFIREVCCLKIKKKGIWKRRTC